MTQFIPPLTWFRAFESAARHLSFTKAAEELHVSQSAISQHVRSLENRLGCDLFVRRHRSLHLTDQGRRLLPKVSQAVAGFAEIAGSFATGDEDDTLTVVVSPSIARAVIIPELPGFTTAHPGTRIHLSTRTWPDEFSSVDADIEVRFDTPQSSRRGGELLGHQRMQVVAAPDLLATAGPEIVTRQDCYRLPRIKVAGTADTWESFATPPATVSQPRQALHVESHGLAVDMAVAGLGLAYTNSLVADRAVAEGRLSVLFEEDAAPADGYYLLARDSGRQPRVAAFVAWLRSVTAQRPAR